MTTETAVGSAVPSRVVDSVVWCGCPAFATAHPGVGVVWLRGWVGCGPYSGRFAFTVSLTPHISTHVVCGVCWGVVVCVGLLVPVSSQTVAGLPLLAYQPSSLLGAYQKGQVLLVETLS